MFESHLHVMALPWCELLPHMLLTAFENVKLFVFIEIFIGMVSGDHFDTGAELPIWDHAYEDITEDKKLDIFKRSQEHV